MTENNYDVLIGFLDELCDDEGVKLYCVKDVADFIHTMGGGYITEADGTPLLEIQERDFVFCNDVHYKYALMAELRKGKGFEDRNWL